MFRLKEEFEGHLPDSRRVGRQAQALPDRRWPILASMEDTQNEDRFTGAAIADDKAVTAKLNLLLAEFAAHGDADVREVGQKVEGVHNAERSGSTSGRGFGDQPSHLGLKIEFGPRREDDLHSGLPNVLSIRARKSGRTSSHDRPPS